MRILLVTESIPFPPRNGRELPTAKIFEHFLATHTVDIVVVGKDKADFETRLPFVPESVNEMHFLPYQQLGAVRRILNELLLIKPAYFYRQLESDKVKALFLGKTYDFAWINPPGNKALLERCANLNIPIAKHSVLGMNDLKSALYADKIHQVKGGNFKWAYLMHWLRSFFIARMEKKYLQDFDLIHVQTAKEKRKTVKLIGKPEFVDRIIDSPNGVKEFLFNARYAGIDSKAILFMTHLNGERKYESKWFITKVWPKIRVQTDAELWLVGAPKQTTIPYVDEDNRIKPLGYVPDLTKTFEAVRLSVVPIFHGTGLINRIQDTLVAGVPTVASKLAASTFPDARHEDHLLIAERADDFAKAVIRLYHSRNLRMGLSINGRLYAKQQPGWAETAARLLGAMEKIAQSNENTNLNENASDHHSDSLVSTNS